MISLFFPSTPTTKNTHNSKQIWTRRFGITGSAISWNDSLLSTRTQSFAFCSGQTEPFTVDCGVPQGSVLGPLQFICYTEDVQHVFELHRVGHRIYADDKQINASGGISQLSDIRRHLSDCANKIDRWCDSRRLRLNGNKSELLRFGSKSNLAKLSGEQLTVSIGRNTVEPLHVVRDLGIQLDDGLNTKHHEKTFVGIALIPKLQTGFECDEK
jgi:hypothetical protein